ncbi:MAG: crossover junction endodeoxyribonuclease RuvC [bacterium]|nr:crossover junction endodeoxyribonuclease RuvC [bacterium]
MKILGIDPGTNRIGYGLINDRPLKLIDYGVLEIKERSSKKFLLLAEGLERLITDFKPDFAGVEKIYFAKNQKTAIEVAQARGIILYLLLKNKIAFAEYGPQEIKSAVTGYGLADKKAVAKLVAKLLQIDKLHGHDDASDALAIAITAVNNYRY